MDLSEADVIRMIFRMASVERRSSYQLDRLRGQVASAHFQKTTQANELTAARAARRVRAKGVFGVMITTGNSLGPRNAGRYCAVSRIYRDAGRLGTGTGCIRANAGWPPAVWVASTATPGLGPCSQWALEQVLSFSRVAQA
jgi:hypothetical protein